MAVPRITARTRSPSARARASGFSTSTPTASAGTNPSPSAPKLRQRREVEVRDMSRCCTNLFGCRERLTAPARATSQSPARSARTARWRAASDEEHMASTARLGPCRSRMYETRLAMLPSAPPL
ncbi:hypothetical protein SVIOM342S_03627 [Streptomyces violaceorubidus]